MCVSVQIIPKTEQKEKGKTYGILFISNSMCVAWVWSPTEVKWVNHFGHCSTNEEITDKNKNDGCYFRGVGGAL